MLSHHGRQRGIVRKGAKGRGGGHRQGKKGRSASIEKCMTNELL